ncbi:MAG: LuxR C-terminal-related transcriptional regulator, partial [Bacteroidota bacterium]
SSCPCRKGSIGVKFKKFMMRLCFGILLSAWFLGCPSYATTIDSLDYQLLSATGQQRVNLLNQIARISPAEHAQKTAQQAFSLAQSIDYRQGQALAAYQLGVSNQGSSDPAVQIEAISNYQKALQLFQDLSDTANMIQCYSQLMTYIDQIEPGHQGAYLIAEDQQRYRQVTYFLMGIILLLTVLLLSLDYHYRQKIKWQQRQNIKNLEEQREAEQEKRQQMEVLLAFRERKLASLTLNLLQKNEMLERLQSSIRTLNTHRSTEFAQNIGRMINKHRNFDDGWQKFKMHFELVHPAFFERLFMQFPKINPNESRFCAYIKMGLSTKEIAHLMGISSSGVQKARYRLKKKMNLDREVDLIEFLTKY